MAMRAASTHAYMIFKSLNLMKIANVVMSMKKAVNLLPRWTYRKSEVLEIDRVGLVDQAGIEQLG